MKTGTYENFRSHGINLVIYTLISTLSFLIDISMLHIMANLFLLNQQFSVFLGFISGSYVHYCLSITYIFRKKFKNEAINVIFYIKTGLAVLVIQSLIIHAGVSILNFDLLASKTLSAIISLPIGYAVRKVIF